MTALALAEVWFSYDEVPVLEGVSLVVEKGEQVALMGPNGVGKTTLTKLAVALLHPARGEVLVAGSTTKGKHPEDFADGIAYVFQHPDQQLFARTVLDEVTFGPLLQDRSREEARTVARAALEQVGLLEHSDVHPYDLAPADRKQVALAAAIAQRPSVLILDEPTQGLDRAGVSRVSSILREVAARDVAVLAVTHDLGFVAETFARSIVLSQGQVAFDGPSRELVLDESRVSDLGLAVPPAARLSLALGLPGTPIRIREVAQALADRGTGGPPIVV